MTFIYQIKSFYFLLNKLRVRIKSLERYIHTALSHRLYFNHIISGFFNLSSQFCLTFVIELMFYSVFPKQMFVEAFVELPDELDFNIRNTWLTVQQQMLQ